MIKNKGSLGVAAEVPFWLLTQAWSLFLQWMKATLISPTSLSGSQPRNKVVTSPRKWLVMEPLCSRELQEETASW